MFRQEKYVEINGRQISKNGFKNLSFETSKFSNSLTAIRGFGSNLDEKNLNTIDTLALEFYVDVDELPNFAYIYSLFKAFGALPIKNEYIIKKLKSSLAIERSVVDFAEPDYLKKNIDHLIVFLQDIRIKSLEKTNNGYSVNMIFTLHKDAFTKEEFKHFYFLYEEWDKETNFTSICESTINSQLIKLKGDKIGSTYPGTGSLKINIYNIDKLNAKNKGKVYLNTFKSLDKDDPEENIDKENNKLNVLRGYENLDTKYSISIPNVNIAQIELITSNIIANIPLHGEPIGIKSFMGMGPSSFTVKMIFDEKDAELLEELKTLSDKNVQKHKIELEQALVNMFDFHSASINNVIFNNIEQANGVMVTIVFKINSYNFVDSNKLNSNTIANLDGIDKTNSYNAILGFNLEGITEYLLKNGDGISKNEEKTHLKDSDKTYQSYTSRNSIIENFLQTIVESKHSGNTQSSGQTIVEHSYIGQYLSLYNSWITSFGHFNTRFINDKAYQNPKSVYTFNFKEDHLNKYFNISINDDNTNLHVIPSIFLQSITPKNKIKELSSTSIITYRELFYDEIEPFYDYCETISAFTIISNKKAKELLKKQFNDSGFINKLYNLFLNDLMEYCYNIKSNLQDDVTAIIYGNVLKELYTKMFYILNFSETKNIINRLLEEELLFSSGNINYKKIHSFIKEIFDSFYSQFMSVLTDDIFIEMLVKDILEVKSNTIINYESSFNMQLINVQSIIDKLKKEYKRAYDNDSSDIIDKIYNVFLSKLTFGLSMVYSNQVTTQYFNEKIDKELYIKTILLSSTVMGFLFLRTPNRTDEYGLIFENTSIKIARKIAKLLKEANIRDIIESKKLKPEQLTSEFLFLKRYEETVQSSYYKEFINWDSVIPNKSYEKKDINKDFNFFYGNKIENKFPEKYIEDTLNTSVDNAVIIDGHYSFNSFLENAKNDFINNNKYSKWIDIDYSTNDEMENLFANRNNKMPTFAEAIMRNEDNISSVMKRRIIGNRDPFMDMKKISDIVHNTTTKTIPNYDISIQHKEYYSDYSGAYNTVKLNAILSINNLVQVSISKNSSKKIKTAVIKIVDMNKELLENYEDGSVRIIGTKEDTLRLISINVGDKIDVSLGYSDNQKNVFRGFINQISYYNNILEFSCIDAASSLYNYHIDSLKLSSTNPSNITEGIKVGWSYIRNFFGYTFQDRENEEQRRNNWEEYFYNQHLFHYYDDQKMNYKLYIPGIKSERATMFNATIAAFYKLPSNIKTLFDNDNIYNKYNLLTMKLMEEDSLNSAFGSLIESKDPISLTLSTKAFENINNVDRDYETYGIFFEDKQIKNEFNKVDNQVSDNVSDDSFETPIDEQNIEDAEVKDVETENTEKENVNDRYDILNQQINDSLIIGDITLELPNSPNFEYGDFKNNHDEYIKEPIKDDLIKYKGEELDLIFDLNDAKKGLDTITSILEKENANEKIPYYEDRDVLKEIYLTIISTITAEYNGKYNETLIKDIVKSITKSYSEETPQKETNNPSENKPKPNKTNQTLKPSNDKSSNNTEKPNKENSTNKKEETNKKQNTNQKQEKPKKEQAKKEDKTNTSTTTVEKKDPKEQTYTMPTTARKIVSIFKEAREKLVLLKQNKKGEYIIEEGVDVVEKEDKKTKEIKKYKVTPRYHWGIDISHKIKEAKGNNDDLIAIYKGKVEKIVWEKNGGGHGIKIHHEELDMTTVYFHMKAKSHLKVGDTVEAGDKVGIMGNTGASAGQHLHFEIYIKGVRVDPFDYLGWEGFHFDWAQIGQSTLRDAKKYKSFKPHGEYIKTYKKNVQDFQKKLEEKKKKEEEKKKQEKQAEQKSKKLISKKTESKNTNKTENKK